LEQANGTLLRTKLQVSSVNAKFFELSIALKRVQPPFFGPAPSASAQPEAVTIVAMFHDHPFYLNNAAALKAAAGARACTTKTTTTKD
jgi:hypothetical protein